MLLPLKQRNKTLAAISISIPVFRATKEKLPMSRVSC